MELRFAAPSLSHLDELDAEILACGVWSDERPVHGLAGLCDWRMGGRLSELLRSGFITGEDGEVVLLSAKPHLSFDKLILFGAGSRPTFTEAKFQVLVERMLATMEGLASRVAVVELPGRSGELISAPRAADILLACAGVKREHDIWTLLENSEAKQRITEYMIEERRRIRRLY